MSVRNKHHEAVDRRHDATVEDSFPARDPPANSGIVGPRVGDAPATATSPPHKRGDEARPKGTHTHERHAAETAHSRESQRSR